MKKLYLLRIEVWWFVERVCHRLYGHLPRDCHGDGPLSPLLIFASRRRRAAEDAYCMRFHENIYGEKLTPVKHEWTIEEKAKLRQLFEDQYRGDH